MVSAPATRTRAWEVAASVLDPEVPVLTIEDLGILRDVPRSTTAAVQVQDHPDVLRLPGDGHDPRRRGSPPSPRPGYDDVRVEFVLAPAWTTDWMSEEGKAQARRLRHRAAAAAGPRRWSPDAEPALPAVRLARTPAS